MVWPHRAMRPVRRWLGHRRAAAAAAGRRRRAAAGRRRGRGAGRTRIPWRPARPAAGGGARACGGSDAAAFGRRAADAAGIVTEAARAAQHVDLRVHQRDLHGHHLLQARPVRRRGTRRRGHGHRRRCAASGGAPRRPAGSRAARPDLPGRGGAARTDAGSGSGAAAGTSAARKSASSPSVPRSCSSGGRGSHAERGLHVAARCISRSESAPQLQEAALAVQLGRVLPSSPAKSSVTAGRRCGTGAPGRGCARFAAMGWIMGSVWRGRSNSGAAAAHAGAALTGGGRTGSGGEMRCSSARTDRWEAARGGRRGPRAAAAQSSGDARRPQARRRPAARCVGCPPAGRRGAGWPRPRGPRRRRRGGAQRCPASRRGPPPAAPRPASSSSRADAVGKAHGLAQVAHPVAPGPWPAPAVIQSPVTLETKGMRGRRGAGAAHLLANASRMGSIVRGVERVRGVQPARLHAAAGEQLLHLVHVSRRAADTTQCAALFTAASDSRADRKREHLRLRRAARPAWPPAGSSCISRPRAATSRSASARENTPARHAATYSPMLCPSMASGPHAPAHPQLRQRVLHREERRLGERRLAQPRAGRVLVPGRGKEQRSRRSIPSSGAQQLARTRRSRRERRPRPRTARAPSPRTASPARERGRRPAARGPRPASRRGGRPPSARAARASSASPATAAQRWRRAARPSCSVKATSASESSASSSSRAASPSRIRPSAASDFALRTRSCGPSAVSADAGTTGASSSTTCALVPPMPNELTPARRGAPSGDSHGRSAALT